jgi:hypothetical protein
MTRCKSPFGHRLDRVLDLSSYGAKMGRPLVQAVLPPERLDAYSRWSRLIVAQAIHDLARSPARPAAPVLFLLDEFAALGRLEPTDQGPIFAAGSSLFGKRAAGGNFQVRFRSPATVEGCLMY